MAAPAAFLPKGARWADISPSASPAQASVYQPQLFHHANATQPATSSSQPSAAAAGQPAAAKGARAAAALRSRWEDMMDTPKSTSHVMQVTSPLGTPLSGTPLSATSPVAVSPVRAHLPSGTRWADVQSPMQSPVATQRMSLVNRGDGSTWTTGVVVSKTTIRTSPSPAVSSSSPAKAPPSPERKRPIALSNISRSASPASTPVPSDKGSSPEEQNSDDEDVALENLLARKRQEKQQSWANYCTTPMHRMPAPSPVHGKRPRIGIDIGGVVIRDGDPNFNIAGDWDRCAEAPGALDAVKRIASVFGTENTFLVSKVHPGGSMQQKIEHWLHTTCQFCQDTGIPKGNIIFVSAVDGPNGKGAVASQLGLTHFVDDKVKVLNSIFSDEAGNSGHLVQQFDGLLFHFAKGGCHKPAPVCNLEELSPQMRKHYCAVANWSELLAELRAKLPSVLKSDAADKQLEGIAQPVLAAPAPFSMRAEQSPRAAQACYTQSVVVRKKLNLKPRDPTLGPPGGVVSDTMPSVFVASNGTAPAAITSPVRQTKMAPSMPPPLTSPLHHRFSPKPVTPPTPMNHPNMPPAPSNTATQAPQAASGCSSAAAGAALISNLLGNAASGQAPPPAAPASCASCGQPQQQPPTMVQNQQPIPMYGQQPPPIYGQQPPPMYGQQPPPMYGQQQPFMFPMGNMCPPPGPYGPGMAPQMAQPVGVPLVVGPGVNMFLPVPMDRAR